MITWYLFTPIGIANLLIPNLCTVVAFIVGVIKADSNKISLCKLWECDLVRKGKFYTASDTMSLKYPYPEQSKK